MIDNFRIEIPEAALVDLRERLARVRWPAQLLHVRSPEPDAVPLILTHGWPGSVAEFLQILGPLTDPRSHGGDPADAFHIVAPSVPGHGFSVPLEEPGWNHRRIALAWAELMSRLGYTRYGAQGGDTDQLLTDVSLYWFTGSSASAANLYYENRVAPAEPTRPSGVPTGIAVFRTDPAIRRIAEREHHLVHWSEFPRGGHFAAMEAPDLLIDDIRTFFRTLR